MQKPITIFILLIQNNTVPGRCSTIAGGVCIIVMVISPLCNQTSLNHRFYYIYCHYDLSTKPSIIKHAKDILNPLSDTIPNLPVALHPLQTYFHRVIPCFQCGECCSCWWCHCPHTKKVLNSITDTIPNLQPRLQQLQTYIHWQIPYSQQRWCWWRGWCHYCCWCCCSCSRVSVSCYWRCQTCRQEEQLRIYC